jgi:hypothetical protein
MRSSDQGAVSNSRDHRMGPALIRPWTQHGHELLLGGLFPQVPLLDNSVFPASVSDTPRVVTTLKEFPLGLKAF